MKIGVKLVLIISFVNLIGVGVLTIAATMFSSSAITNVAELNARNVTAVTAGSVKAFLEVSMDEIRALVMLMENFDSIVPAAGRRDMVNFYLETLVTRNPDFIGVWAIYEPDMLDGNDAAFVNTPGSDETGRFISYWTNNHGTIDFEALTNYANADYYTVSLRSGKESVAEPYLEIVGGKQTLITSVVIPILRNGRAIGAAGVDLELREIQEMIGEMKPFGTGEAGLYSPSGIVLSAKNPDKLGKNLKDVSKNIYGDKIDTFLHALKTGSEFFDTFYSEEHKERIMAITTPFFIGGDEEAWSAVTIVSEATIMSDVNRMTIVLIILGVVILVIITVIIIFISSSITAPLKKMENIFGFIGNGDFTKTIEAKGNDEIGNISRSLNATMDKIKDLIGTIKNQSLDLSNIGSELSSNMNETAAAINEINANIQSIKSRAINQSASVTETNATMEQITFNISKLDEQVDKQSTSVAQSSSAIEQMLANIQSVTQTLIKNMENVNQLESASEVGRSGLQEVAADIQEIARESEGLLEINSVMENIASQTNLLSMNAAIEAAHAGEAGKGFAVVADEICKLAENSSEQSKTISTVLKKIKESIDKITQSTNNVLQRFEAIDKNIKTVSDQEENIRNAMEEQSQGSKQILEAIGNLNDITRQVKGGSHEMQEGSGEVIREGKNLEIITQEITGGMNEMATGADQINIAVHRVNELTVSNKDKVNMLLSEVAKFKVE